MKWIAFLLLGANLLFLGFYVTNPPDSTSDETSPPEWSGNGRLIRIAELSGNDQLPKRKALDKNVIPEGVTSHADSLESAVVTPVSPAPGQTNCYEVSGFADEKTALEAQIALDAAGVDSDPPRLEHVDRLRYWVLLPPFNADVQTRAAVERLKGAGINDYYLIPSGENKNALSLGVFSTREAAQQRVSEIASLKWKVRVEEVSFPTRHYVFRLRLKPGEPSSKWQQLFPAGVVLQGEECN
jgi:hypothetical protein